MSATRWVRVKPPPSVWISNPPPDSRWLVMGLFDPTGGSKWSMAAAMRQHADVSCGRRRAGEIFLRPHLAGFAAPVGAQTARQPSARSRRRLARARSNACCSLSGMSKPCTSMAPSGRCRSRRACDARRDLAGEGEDAARQACTRHDLVGGDPRRISPSAGRPRGRGQASVTGPSHQAAFAHGDDEGGQHREIMHLQRRRQHVRRRFRRTPAADRRGN